MTSNPDTAAAVPGFFSRYQGEIDASLREELRDESMPLYETHRYYMGWQDENGAPASAASSGGKRLRPTLVLLAADASRGSLDRAMPVAVALEYIHNFSLIHDDLEDGDRIRHHRPTVWAVWGEAAAIVSGNAMLAVADRAVKKLTRRGVEPGLAIEAAHRLTEDYLRMMEGQYLDISYESRPKISIEQYLEMIEHKTGALIEASVYLGALVSGDGSPACRAVAEGLRTVGFELGRVFQIRDDVLGVWGGDATGKPVGADIKRKKKALPAVHALNASSGTAQRRVEEIFAADEVSDSGVADVLQIMEDLGTQDYCQSMAETRWLQARDVLKSLSLPELAQMDFLELGEFLLVREH